MDVQNKRFQCDQISKESFVFFNRFQKLKRDIQPLKRPKL